MATRRFAVPLSALTVAAVLTACGGGSKNDKSPVGRIVERTVGTSTAAAPATAAVPTATAPEDPCAWIPVAEVEAIVGTLAEPPRPADGCRYVLAMPESVKAARQDAVTKQEQLQQRLKATFKDYEPPQFGGSMANFQRDPRTYAISLKVGVAGNMAGEQGADAGARVLASWMPKTSRPGAQPAPAAAPDEPKPANGWDREFGLPYGFVGRIGHVTVSVQADAPDVPDALMRALAVRVRDRIPDLPFPVTNPYQVIQLGGRKDPCSLLARAEAEAVLGPLAVDPYPSSSEYLALAHSKGHACAYFTAGHHAFVVAPTWSAGEEDFRLEKGIAGLIGIVAPQEQVIFKGPWDQAHVSAGTGALLFLKGDQLLTVHYLTSSTDRRGAVKLAAQAIGRMAS
jgi:hypothetical protein